MNRVSRHQSHVPFIASVRVRLTLWYLAVMVFIVVVFGGSLYATQTFLNVDAAESRVEAQLYQDSQQFAAMYRQALLTRQTMPSVHPTLSSQEVLLLLGSDGN